MDRWHRLTLSSFFLLVAAAQLTGCPAAHEANDAGLPTPDGGGVCCPVGAAPGCGYWPGVASGGWAPSESACAPPFDVSGWAIFSVDEHGCPVAVPNATGGCLGPDGGPPIDAGPPSVDAPGPVDAVLLIDAAPGTDAPGACTGLAPAACLGAFCVPVFDDACCRTCTPGGPCADCTNLEYHSCRPYADAPCLGGGSCGSAPIWACGPTAPNCATANVVDLDSCDVTGCVPAYPSAMGDPDITMATCRPILAESCTIACRIVAPPCPTGTWPEGDGRCYTNRCIPMFVCGR